MQILKNQILLMKKFISNAIKPFKTGKALKEIMPEKPKRSTEYSNIVRRILLLIFTGQWLWLMAVSERMYIKNGDIGDNWTKLMISVVGLLTLVCGFYFSGQYSDRNSEEFKKIKEYDNDRMSEYKEVIKEELVDEITPKATLEEDEDDA